MRDAKLARRTLPSTSIKRLEEKEAVRWRALRLTAHRATHHIKLIDGHALGSRGIVGTVKGARVAAAREVVAKFGLADIELERDPPQRRMGTRLGANLGSKRLVGYQAR